VLYPYGRKGELNTGKEKYDVDANRKQHDE